MSVHIFGVADDTPLSAITSAMEKFGSVIGVPKRETKAVEGCTFTTGTTFVNLVPTAIVPSTIMLSESRQKLRVWHRVKFPRATSVAPVLIIAIKTALWQFSKKSYCVLVHGPRLKSKKLTKCDS